MQIKALAGEPRLTTLRLSAEPQKALRSADPTAFGMSMTRIAEVLVAKATADRHFDIRRRATLSR